MPSRQRRSPATRGAGENVRIRVIKKSKNPYINFTQTFLRNYSGDLTVHKERMREAASRWREMTGEEKRPFMDMAARAKRRRRII